MLRQFWRDHASKAVGMLWVIVKNVVFHFGRKLESQLAIRTMMHSHDLTLFVGTVRKPRLDSSRGRPN